jgi:hypothetical protein
MMDKGVQKLNHHSFLPSFFFNLDKNKNLTTTYDINIDITLKQKQID